MAAERHKKDDGDDHHLLHRYISEMEKEWLKQHPSAPWHVHWSKNPISDPPAARLILSVSDRQMWCDFMELIYGRFFGSSPRCADWLSPPLLKIMCVAVPLTAECIRTFAVPLVLVSGGGMPADVKASMTEPLLEHYAYTHTYVRAVATGMPDTRRFVCRWVQVRA